MEVRVSMKNQTEGLKTVKDGVENETEGHYEVDGEESLIGEGQEALTRCKAASEDVLVEADQPLPRRLEAASRAGRHPGWRAGRVGTPGAARPALTQGEASVELQVGSEEAGQAGENLATGLPAVDLVAAVHQAVGRAPVVCFVQHPAEQLPFPDDHLQGAQP